MVPATATSTEAAEPVQPTPSGTGPHDPPNYLDRAALPIVLCFFASAAVWLLVGSALWLLALLQAADPYAGLSFRDFPGLTFGRVYPAALHIFVYGWASLTGLGCLTWVFSRLNARPLRDPLWFIFGILTWDCGVAFGTLRILGGGSTGREWLEYPPETAFFVLLGELIIAACLIGNFLRRSQGRTHPAQWFGLAALLWFAWSYTTANGLLGVAAAGGVAEPTVQYWYQGCLFSLWLVPLGLALAHYLVPRIAGRPLYSRSLALIGFWGLAALGGLTGLTAVIGGPLPAWMITVSIVARVLLVIPILAIAANLHLTVKGRFELIKWNLVGRFVIVGAMLLGLAAFWDAVNATRTISRITQFTWATPARLNLLLFGFFCLVTFGAIYYILPRVLGRVWQYATYIRWQFWLLIVGLGLLVFDQTIAGVIQGLGLEDPKVEFPAILDLIAPFLWGQWFAAIVLVVSNVLGVWALLTVIVNPIWQPARAVYVEPVLEFSGEEVTVA